MRKILANLLVLALLLTAFPVCASDELPTFASAEEKICYAIDNRLIEINVEEFNITEDPQVFFRRFLSHHSNYFYVTLSYYYMTKNDTVAMYVIDYIWQGEELDNKIAQFNRAVEDLIDSIPKGISDEDKVLYLHDYLCINVEYDTRVYEHPELTEHDPTIRTSYGALVDKKAVCQGVSKAYVLLLETLGIEAHIARSSEMDHEWIMVKLGDHFYHIDTTYDSPVVRLKDGELLQFPGYITHKYFLKSDEQMLELGHYGWETFENVVADDSTTYDNAYFYQAMGMIAIIDGDKYFVRAKGEEGELVKLDGKTGYFRVLFTMHRHTWCPCCHQRDFYWHGNTTRFAYDGKGTHIYFNHGNRIFSYNIKNDSAVMVKMVSLDGYIFSCAFIDEKLEIIDITDFEKDENGNVIINSNGSRIPVYEHVTVEINDDAQETLLMGDVNSDNSINTLDMLALRKYLAHTGEVNTQTADLCFDHKITARDAFYLRCILSGKGFNI